ncbi:acyl--CoA ligase [Streptomyces sp. XM83C]|jgi:acyl-coenzyme A synthetase/AMP-(fatty) acid ligase|uniref:Class I adenylate-forming enzyme family protein n=1 Tax=Streptomyces thermocoprophilus TaxID=78356 RepID=A0ABV5VG45_9ACTN|nr:class I adenylate-forming enzyme family protein [Streptomyces sp. XM83C]MCK1821569.1 acyl--CoA ligase [Streptomyces sp. XM83C]
MSRAVEVLPGTADGARRPTGAPVVAGAAAGAGWVHPDASVTEYTSRGVRVLDAAALTAGVAERADQWAALGFAPGDRVLVGTGSRLTTLLDVAAAWDAGLVPVLLSDALAPDSYRLLAAATGAVAGRLTPAVARTWAAHGSSPLARDAGTVLLRLDGTPGAGAPPYDEPSLVLATSGSTGLPKAVVHRRSRLLRNAGMHWDSVGGLGPGDRYLLSQSMYFSSAFVCGVLGVLASGAALALVEPPFSTANWFDTARGFAATHTALTPHLLMRVLDSGEPFPASLRQITVGGDRLGRTALAELRARGVPDVRTTYGLTEAGPRVATHTPGDAPYDGGLGLPLAGVSWRLEPDGELVVRTPTAQTGSYIDGGHVPYPAGDEVPTGDICEELPDGTYRLVGRARRVTSVAGEKVFLGLVERVLVDHPEVSAARVAADGDDGSGLAAQILPRPGGPGVDAAELRRWCRGRLRAVEVPRTFTLVDSSTQLSK